MCVLSPSDVIDGVIPTFGLVRSVVLFRRRSPRVLAEAVGAAADNVGMVIGSIRVPRAESVLSARRGCWGGISFQTTGLAVDLWGAIRTEQLSVMCRDWT